MMFNFKRFDGGIGKGRTGRKCRKGWKGRMIRKGRMGRMGRKGRKGRSRLDRNPELYNAPFEDYVLRKFSYRWY